MPNEASAEILRAERRYQMVEPLGDLQERFGVAPVMLPPETFTTTMLGTSLTFDLAEWWRLEFAGPGRLDIVPVDEPLGSSGPRLSILRPNGWYGDRWLRMNDSQPTGATPDYEPGEMETWLTEHSGLAVSGTGSLTNGVQYHDAAATETSGATQSRYCDALGMTNCVPLTLGGLRLSVIQAGQSMRLYLLDQADTPVVAIAVGEAQDLPQFDAIIESIEVGPAGETPHLPGYLLWSGETPDRGDVRRSTAIPGLSLEVVSDWPYNQRPGQVSNGTTSISLPASTGNGDPLQLVDDVVAAFLDPMWGLEVTETAMVEVLGKPARTFDITGGPSNVLLVTEVEPGTDLAWGAWMRSSAVRVRVVQTELGVLVLSEAGDTLTEIGERGWLLEQMTWALSIDAIGP